MSTPNETPAQALQPDALPAGSDAEAVTFADFDLPEALEKGLLGAGWKVPTTIQAKTIPLGLAGHDVLASAQTGTGKTAAFAVPALNMLLRGNAPKSNETQGNERQGGSRKKPPSTGPRVLVLTPTRELAGQVEGVARKLAAHTRLRLGQVVGGVSYGPQERLLRGGVDMLVATPGRLLDHMEQGTINLSHVEMFVLDEADRMLDMGFVKPVKRIAAALPTKRQTLLFSATLEGQVMSIAKQLLHEPVEVRLASSRERHAGIEQRMHSVRDAEQKHTVLGELLGDPALTQAIVFTATKRGADRLAKRLQTQGHPCAALHGNMRQNARDKTVDLLRRGKVQILVATDVAARGIDVLGISHVINFDLPQVAEDYIHRIGRTGRNGATGIAVSLVSPADRIKLGQIERLTGRRLTGEPMPSNGNSSSPSRGNEAPRSGSPRSTPRRDDTRSRGYQGNRPRRDTEGLGARASQGQPTRGQGQGRSQGQGQEQGQTQGQGHGQVVQGKPGVQSRGKQAKVKPQGWANSGSRRSTGRRAAKSW